MRHCGDGHSQAHVSRPWHYYRHCLFPLPLRDVWTGISLTVYNGITSPLRRAVMPLKRLSPKSNFHRPQPANRRRTATMSYCCGIIGLPNAGKTTIFNALTAGAAEVAPYPFCTITPNTGVVPVPDPRLARLGQLLQPQNSPRRPSNSWTWPASSRAPPGRGPGQPVSGQHPGGGPPGPRGALLRRRGLPIPWPVLTRCGTWRWWKPNSCWPTWRSWAGSASRWRNGPRPATRPRRETLPHPGQGGGRPQPGDLGPGP